MNNNKVYHIVDIVYNEKIKPYYNLIEYNCEQMAENIYFNDEKLNEKNLSKFFKSKFAKEKYCLMKYYDCEKKTKEYIYWKFHYDGHANFYILFDAKTKYWYLLTLHGDVDINEDYIKLKLASVSFKINDDNTINLIDDEESRYWVDIWKSKYMEDIFNLIFYLEW